MISTSVTQAMSIEKIGDKAQNAWTRSAVALGWKGVAHMKGRVHRLTGTLSRSLHVSVREEGHEGDFAEAKGSEIKETVSPKWSSGACDVLAGSWIPYAGPEARRGGAHDFFTPAVEVIKKSIQSTYKQALGEEF